MRESGAKIADIAILIVSAEDGVMPQTKEAFDTIVKNKVSCIVAISKADKPNANIQKKKKFFNREWYLYRRYGWRYTFCRNRFKD